MVEGAAEAPALARGFDEAVQLLEILVEHPGAIRDRAFDADQQRRAPHIRASGGERAAIAIFPDIGLDERPWQPIDGREGRASGQAEVAEIGAVRSLGIVDPLDQFGNDEVEVEIALAVAVAAHVDRHAVDERRKIGAVIEIEAAQEILVGLAGSGMLGGDQARHVLGQLADPADRLVLEVAIADRAFRRGDGLADPLERAPVDDQLLIAGSRLGRRIGRGRDRLGTLRLRRRGRQKQPDCHQASPDREEWNENEL